MDPEHRGDADHHDGTTDAMPRGYAEKRRPGELAFALFLAFGSICLLYNAYGISGFDALSAPGSVPMATSLVLVISTAMIVWRTARLHRVASQTLAKDIVPAKVILFVCFLIAFGVLLKPLGFVPTAALFLILSIKVLARKSWRYTLLVSLGSLVVIWVVFRLVFTVLLPAGILPEAEFIQFFRSLLAGGAV